MTAKRRIRTFDGDKNPKIKDSEWVTKSRFLWSIGFPSKNNSLSLWHFAEFESKVETNDSSGGQRIKSIFLHIEYFLDEYLWHTVYGGRKGVAHALRDVAE